MKTLTQYITEANSSNKKFAPLNKQFYVIVDPYYKRHLNIVTKEDMRCYIAGATGESEDWALYYEDLSPKDILYSTNTVKDAVNWVLKYKKIDPKKFLKDLNYGNEDCDDPYDYEEDNDVAWGYKLHDTDRFYWAVLHGYWDDDDIMDGANEYYE